MSLKDPPKFSGYLFIASGVAYFVASVIGKQAAPAVLGAIFIALGAEALRKASGRN